MKRYIVDISHLSSTEKDAARKQLSGYCFMVNFIYDERNQSFSPEAASAVALEVFWDSSENFADSLLRPAGCPYREV